MSSVPCKMMAMLALLTVSAPALAAEKATVYKDPSCGCCAGHAEHLRASGYEVSVVETADLDAVKARHQVPEALQGCHTTLVGGYVVEGHVPAAVIARLLRERPPIPGISLPGMPEGSPGMGGRKSAPFVVLELSPGTSKIYAVD